MVATTMTVEPEPESTESLAAVTGLSSGEALKWLKVYSLYLWSCVLGSQLIQPHVGLGIQL